MLNNMKIVSWKCLYMHAQRKILRKEAPLLYALDLSHDELVWGDPYMYIVWVKTFTPPLRFSESISHDREFLNEILHA